MNYNQFVPLSQALIDFGTVEHLLTQYGEIIIVKDDRPKYRITTIDGEGDIATQAVINSPQRVTSKEAETMEILNKIGKSTFIEHYYDFKHNLTPADDLPEDFTKNSKRSRTSKARKIFREGLYLEALQIIINSNRLDPKIINKAKEIYEQEISES